MTRFLETVANRRSYYALSKKSPISDEEIISMVETAIKRVPTSFNMQSITAVLLLGEHHNKFWQLVLEAIKEVAPPEQFEKSKEKVTTSFASGYGTLLFYNDNAVTEEYSNQFPDYRENFTKWSHHSSAMLQHTLWVALEDVGFGASLQHYSPIVDERAREEWNIPESWELIAQMPFGIPLDVPEEKTARELKERLHVHR